MNLIVCQFQNKRDMDFEIWKERQSRLTQIPEESNHRSQNHLNIYTVPQIYDLVAIIIIDHILHNI